MSSQNNPVALNQRSLKVTGISVLSNMPLCCTAPSFSTLVGLHPTKLNSVDGM